MFPSFKYTTHADVFHVSVRWGDILAHSDAPRKLGNLPLNGHNGFHDRMLKISTVHQASNQPTVSPQVISRVSVLIFLDLILGNVGYVQKVHRWNLGFTSGTKRTKIRQQRSHDENHLTTTCPKNIGNV